MFSFVNETFSQLGPKIFSLLSLIPWTTLLFYSFLVFLFVFVFIILYLKSKYKFWVYQPVFHVYDFSYYLYPPGIIRLDLPEKNKYTNFKEITTFTYDKLTSLQRQEFVSFIQLHYLKNGDNVFQPKHTHIFPYFEGFPRTQCFFSFYEVANLLSDLKKGTIIENKKIIGCMTGRPVTVKFFKEQKQISAYYIDYLCVDKTYRKKGIAPQLIQTHEYNQRHLNKEVQVSLFKREGELTGIVPLCVYTTYGFSVHNWGKPAPISSPSCTLLEVTKQNLGLLNDFFKETESYFQVIIDSPLTNLWQLIQTKNMYIYILLDHGQPLSAYFYRKTCVLIDKGLEVLTCYASIKHAQCSPELFVEGFKNSFWNTAEKNHFGFCAVENISHNHIIVTHLLKKNKPQIESPTAYFFYNFAYHTVPPEKVCIKGT